MISEASEPSPEVLGRFLSQYGAWLLGSGSTCIRVEKNINRMAHAFGMDVEITILPRHLQIAVCRCGRDSVATCLSAVCQTPTSFNIITRRRVFLKLSAVCPGIPLIKSTLILEKPAILAF